MLQHGARRAPLRMFAWREYLQPALRKHSPTAAGKLSRRLPLRVTTADRAPLPNCGWHSRHYNEAFLLLQ